MVKKFDWYLFQLTVVLKPDYNCLPGFTLSSVDKVTAGTKCFVSVIVKAGTGFATAPATKKKIFRPFHLKTNFKIN